MSASQHLKNALLGEPFVLAELLANKEGFQFGNMLVLPPSTAQSDLDKFAFMIEARISGWEVNGVVNIRRPRIISDLEVPLPEPEQPLEATEGYPGVFVFPSESFAVDASLWKPAPLEATTKQPETYKVEAVMHTEVVSGTGLPVATVVTELGTPEALETQPPWEVEAPVTVTETPIPEPPAPEPTKPVAYIDDLPQSVEFLRITLTEMVKRNASLVTINMLIKSAVEAKDMGVLEEWKKEIHHFINRDLARGIDNPEDFIPKAVIYGKTKLVRHKDLSDAHQEMLSKLMKLCPDNFKEDTHKWITDGVNKGKLPYYLSAWEEVEFALDQGRSSAPVNHWKALVDARYQQELLDKARQPAKVEFGDAVAWAKRWFPPYDSSKIINDNVFKAPVPLAKRDSTERMAETAFFYLREQIADGAALDVLVNAWSGPAPIDGLQQWWLNGKAEKFQRDGKRYAFSQQHFDSLANALFNEAFRSTKPYLRKWRAEMETLLRKNELIGPAFKQAADMPPIDEEVEE